MNYFKTLVLLAVLTAILVFIGDYVGGKNGAVFGLIFAGLVNFGAYWFSDKIVLAMYRAKEVSEAQAPEVFSTVRRTATMAGLPVPRVYTIDTETPNAFATGRNPGHAAVAVTTGITRLLTKEELSGVLAHELSHIKNRDVLISTIAATIAGAISYISRIAMWSSMLGARRSDRDEGGGNAIALIFMMVVAPMAAFIIQMAISRSREYAADRGGAEITGNPLYLADALRKLAYYNKRAPMQGANEATAHMFIVNPLSGKSLLKLFSTHPPIEERIARLEAMAGRR
ncbi:MAG: zinc metalloprotease HtpX [Deltaproteobacteria bacterium]|nr:zinc metalloprotease HtpX [Deltaproteobacteria bacterium]